MTLRYAVGIKIGNRADQITIEAEDALIAALKVKTAHPEAAITYVRKRNARGDRRHPHSSQIDEDPPGQAAGDAARSRSSVRTMYDIIEDTMAEPVPKPPRRPPAEPIIIKNPFQPAERPEMDRSPDQQDEPEIKVPPESSPKCLRFLDRGNRPTSTGVTELFERKNILRDVHRATRPGQVRATIVARAAEQARRAGVVQCPASCSARVRASEQMASWCLRTGMAMKLRPSSSSSRCCGVALTALSLPNPSKK
jgi:hypothetical protein